MKQLLQEHRGNIAIITIDNTPYLAVRIPGGQTSFSTTRFAAIKNREGYTYKNGALEAWHFTGTCEIDGNIYFYGPYEGGDPLLALLSIESSPLPLIVHLCTLFGILPEQARPFYLNSFIVDIEKKTGVVLPPPVMELLVRNLDVDGRREIRSHYFRAANNYEENAVFFLSAIGYYLCTRTFPEDAFSLQPTNQQKPLQENLLPPHLLNPELCLDLSKLFMEGLLNPGSVSVGFFKTRIAEIPTIEDKTLSAADIASRVREKEELIGARLKRDRRNRFIRKNGWKILIILAAGTLLGVGGGKIIYNATRPPITAGMSEKDVIRLFYKSYNELDHETMEECTVRGLKLKEVDTTTNLFVISRIRQAYERKNPVISAEEWLEGERGSPDEYPLVFGIADLHIINDGGNIFTAEYLEFMPGTMASTEENVSTAESGPVIAKIRERIMLTYEKGGWLISDITELDRTPVTSY